MAEKKNQKKNTAMQREDLQLYRLFAIFGASFIGFAGLRLINEEALLSFLTVGRWFALVFLLLSIAYPIYVRLVKKTDESGKVFTSVGVAYFLIPVFFMLTTYTAFENANTKFQAAYAAISVFAVIYVTFREEFRKIAALCFVCAAFLYYMNVRTKSLFEMILSAAAKGLIFLVPAAVLVLSILAFRTKKGTVSLFGRTVIRFSSKFISVITALFCVYFLASGAILLFLPAAFLYLMITLLVFFITIGIVCTIRLI